MSKGSGYITLGDESLHYIRAGGGSRLLLAFHGYGNDAQLFMPLAQYLGSEYAIISIDLPHHGKSKWPGQACFTPGQLKELAGAMMSEFGVAKVSLAGYSIGGRVCLKLVELVPQHIDKVVLMAPDGLVFNPFYYFLTRTSAGSGIFHSFLKKPEKYAPLIEVARKTKWLDGSKYKFAMQYLQTGEAREFLQRVWPCMSRLIPDTAKLKKAVNSHIIPLHVFMGSYDRIIPVAYARRFKKQVSSARLHIVEKGHRVMDADTLPLIAKTLLS